MLLFCDLFNSLLTLNFRPIFANRSCVAVPLLWRTLSKKRSQCSAMWNLSRYVIQTEAHLSFHLWWERQSLDSLELLWAHDAVSSQVICVHDVSSIYRVPLLLENQGVVGYLSRRLNMPIETRPRKMLTKWKEMSDRWVLSHWLRSKSSAQNSINHTPIYMLPSQVRQTPRAVFYCSGWEVHQVFRLLCFCHQGTGTLSPSYQP